jgi:uncharacterized protein Yka (UPF0111/DUF47 family)
MADAIDVVTDSIEDVLLRLYMFDIREIRSDMFDISDVMIKIIDVLRDAINEFPEFRTSGTLHEKLISINSLEEEADRLYIEAMRKVYTDDSLSPVQVTAWTHIFVYMEEVADAVEDVADVIEGVMMKNV